MCPTFDSTTNMKVSFRREKTALMSRYSALINSELALRVSPSRDDTWDE